MLRICLPLVLALLGAFPLMAQEFSGTVRFSDADTLHVGKVKVRLYGIDAHELGQGCNRPDGTPWPCGKWAADEAQRRYDGVTANCTTLDHDPYGRTVARCLTGGQDIAAALVRDGVALAYRKYSLDYVDAEKQAAFAERGIWSGTMETPEAFRAAARPEPQAVPDDCAIKGNISKSGQIYHLPGQKFYDDTRISPARGERWFCSEAEATAAGWRRAMQ